jgi:hypothetical protein
VRSTLVSYFVGFVYQTDGVASFPVVLTDEEVQYGMDYICRRATIEVKKFVDQKVYKNMSFERNGILYYSRRVLLENITFRCAVTDAMLDL